jgi:DNA-binding transcriptional MocR family regulator
LYLWCRLPDAVRAKEVQRETFRDRVVFVPGEAFYVDRGGTHELRVCFTAQPPERASDAARALARSIAAIERRGEAEPAIAALA